MSDRGVLGLAEQVRLASLQVLVDESAVDRGQRRPVEAVPDGVRQAGPQQFGSFARIGEDGSGERAAGLADFVGPRPPVPPTRKLLQLFIRSVPSYGPRRLRTDARNLQVAQCRRRNQDKGPAVSAVPFRVAARKRRR